MKAAILFVIVLTVIAVVSTIIVISKGDPNYRKSSKRNTRNLTVIYSFTILISFFALALYIWIF